MPPYTYKKPNVTLTISDIKRRRYHIEDGNDGWFRYDDLVDIAKQKQLYFRYIPAGTYLEFGNRAVTETIAIDNDDLRGLILRPIIVGISEAVAKQYYTFYPALNLTPGDYSANWDFTTSEDGLFTEMVQKNTYASGSYTGQQSYVEFRGHDNGGGDYVGLCPNGFFVAGCRRQALSTEMLDALEAISYTDANYTNICWGYNNGNYTWAIHIPLKGRPMLFENTATATVPEDYKYLWPTTWVMRPWTSGQLSEVNPRKLAEEGVTYKIGTIKNAIAVTESSFEDDFAYYIPENRVQPISPGGPCRIENYQGQCAFWLAPLTFRNSLVMRRPFYTGSYIQANITGHVFGSPVPGELPGVSGMGADGLYWEVPPFVGPAPDCTAGCVAAWEACIIAAAGDPAAIDACNAAYDTCFTACQDAIPASGYAAYQAEIYRGEYPATLEAEDIRTYSTPLVDAVTVCQSAEVSDDAVSFVSPNLPPFELSIADELGRGVSQQYDLTISNRPETDPAPETPATPPTRDFTSGRAVNITANWVMRDLADGSDYSEAATSLGQYYIVTEPRDSKYGSFMLTDILGTMALNQWTGSSQLNFRGWYLNEAIEYVLNLAGIGPDWHDIEDLDIFLASDKWQYGAGASYADIVADLAKRAGKNADIWYDGTDNKIKTGCSYCRAKRTSLDWQAHQDAGWNSTGCLAADAARITGGVDIKIVDTSAGNSSLYIAKSLVSNVSYLSQGKYANYIVVNGQTDDGRIIGRYWRDTDSLHDFYSTRYVGFPITYVEDDTELNTQALVSARLLELVHELGPQPLTLNITIPLRVQLRPGHVAEIDGGNYAGTVVDGGKFRITNVSHNFSAAETTLQMRYMSSL